LIVTGFIAPKGLRVVPAASYVLIVCPGRNPEVLATTREKLLFAGANGGPFVVADFPPLVVIDVPIGISPEGQVPVKVNRIGLTEVAVITVHVPRLAGRPNMVSPIAIVPPVILLT
jgi:hypothetical protein